MNAKWRRNFLRDRGPSEMVELHTRVIATRQPLCGDAVEERLQSQGNGTQATDDRRCPTPQHLLLLLTWHAYSHISTSRACCSFSPRHQQNQKQTNSQQKPWRTRNHPWRRRRRRREPQHGGIQQTLRRKFSKEEFWGIVRRFGGFAQRNLNNLMSPWICLDWHRGWSAEALGEEDKGKR